MNDNGTQSVAHINPVFGHIGNLFVILAFVLALLSAVSYFISAQSKNDTEKLKWRMLGRISFFAHAGSVVGIVITMFLMIFNHHFEYQYVWAHSSRDLQTKYILASFWEGQEGSFLLWSFWHVVLGMVLIFTAKKWEPYVLTIVSVVQVFLISFLLGFYFGSFHIGNSPFLLLQDALTKDPVFLYGDYMKFIQDGSGLNALLQNYWMVIHPPVLFCGFASITVPFAFAIAGLWTRDYTGWLKTALPFTLFSGMVLGTGILMGGAWAYEALSFGGFWAWDPVENASLIPWLIMVAGLHCLVVAKSTGHALRTTYVLILLSFFMVLYASFLTRSGVLGSTSVHAFVNEGLYNHLLVFLFSFMTLGITLLIINWKKIPAKEKEEETSSREFWMFIGSMVLLFAGLHVIFFTSIPVWNKLLGTHYSPPPKPVQYYTSVQIWVGITIAMLTAFGQYLKYKKTEARKFFRQTGIAFVLAVIVAFLSMHTLNDTWHITSGRGIFDYFTPLGLLLLMASFTVIANLQYLITVLKGKIKISGASIAHTGFGILLIGILIANAGKHVISENSSEFAFEGSGLDDQFQHENVKLVRNAPYPIDNYWVTFLGDSLAHGYSFYNLQFTKADSATGKILQQFIVHPYLLMDKKMQQLTPNPDTKHFLSYDVFTHVSSLPSDESKNASPLMHTDTVAVGDTLYFGTGRMILKDVVRYPMKNDTLAAGALFNVTVGNKTETVEPKFYLFDNLTNASSGDAALKTADVNVTFTNILPEQQKFVFTIADKSLSSDWIVIKSIIFPMINLVWLGMATMALGFFVSMLRRISENRRKNKVEMN